VIRPATTRLAALSLAGAVVLLGGDALPAPRPGATSPASQITNPVPSTPKSIGAGRQLFNKYCQGCHGPDAKGDGPLAPKDVHPPNLSDAEWKYGSTDGEIYTNIREGIGPTFNMKPMKSRMTPTEIWNIVNYLRSLSVG
jgi:mono/diheme cytochrome c family protein